MGDGVNIAARLRHRCAGRDLSVRGRLPAGEGGRSAIPARPRRSNIADPVRATTEVGKPAQVINAAPKQRSMFMLLAAASSPSP